MQALCDGTLKKEPNPSPLALKIAAAARLEHQRWQGHKIDHTGRLYQFGLVEAENQETPIGKDAKLQDVGWWNVWRYWNNLFDQEDPSASEKDKLLSRLKVTSIDDAIEQRNPEKALPKIQTETLLLLKSLNKIDDEKIKQSLKESVIRAFVTDNPWSAAFVSYVVDSATKKTAAPPRFASSSSHITYIREGLKTSKDEADGNGVGMNTLYRACPIHSTRPREGDLVCYQREEMCKDAKAEDIRNLLTFKDQILSKPDCKKIEVTHCDVVVRIDLKASKVYTVGGNVLQSVTERRMYLTEKVWFSENQGEQACLQDQIKGAQDDKAVPKGKHCSLNKKDWFVLLQARESQPAIALHEIND